MNARQYYFVWLSKRELEDIARNLAKFYEVEADPADLAGGNLEDGAYGGSLIERLMDDYGLSKSDALWLVKYTLPEYSDEELSKRVRMTMWLSKRKVKRLAEIIYEYYGVKVKPSALARGGAFVATLFDKLYWYPLSNREIALAIDATLSEF
jgi:hypothetical protein